jgi:pimeloyl-ACP methyl ester carboxylesterase
MPVAWSTRTSGETPMISSAMDSVSAGGASIRFALAFPAAFLGALVFSLAMNAAAAEGDQPKPATPPAAPAVAHKPGEVVLQSKSLALSPTEKIDYDLGTIYVPENRSDPKSRIIGVGFARFKAATPTSSPPVFHLPGGPGNSFVMLLTGLDRARAGAAGRNSMVSHFLLFRAVSDVVLVDQRGFSDQGDVMKYPYQSPEEPLDQPESMARETAAFLQLSRDAIADFQKKGFDLRGYTVKNCAEDVNDVRKALGYDKISIVGTSYGSQWTFATMRLHPEIVARVILSGVEPIDYGFDMPSKVFAAMQRYWKKAEQNKALQSYMPPGGLQAAAGEVLKRLEAAPVKVQVKDPKDGAMVTVVLGKEDFQRDFMHGPSDGPAWLLSLYYRHYDAWALSVLKMRHTHQGTLRLIGPLIDTSLGVSAKRERELKSDPGARFLGQWNWDSYIASADIWPSPDVGDDFRVAIKNPIPIIFAQGDWDTSTPVENTLDIVKSFPNGRVIIAEHGGHGVLEPIAQRFPKVWEDMLEFLRTGKMPNLPERVTLPIPGFAVPGFPPLAAK